jgi:hypothetical protein
VGCGRWLEDTYSENAIHRQGLTLGFMYQVVDVAQVTAAATAELDALTVGMVCVRILQKSGGRYIGRWSYGHHLWTEYPAIGEELNNRTINIQQKLGLLKPNAADGDSSTKTGKTADSGGSDKKGASTAKQSMTAASNSQTPMTTESRSLLNSSWKIGVGFPEFEDEEADSLDIRRSVTKAVAKVRLDCLDCLYGYSFCPSMTCDLYLFACCSLNRSRQSSFGCRSKILWICSTESTSSPVCLSSFTLKQWLDMCHRSIILQIFLFKQKAKLKE